ncbi:hypothetical protein CYMTET_45896 [Cymbomonas tetramitiformis]|uniref:DDE-1 domain-containing protein n=1 Tax=Cymbomonas tetramitiformis TaxID=36881 RepID=A0AAE0EXK6_9CHLO|nr:hypothetical protein CYMTET_45896 [Cymbomonas tetramitiformis]
MHVADLLQYVADARGHAQPRLAIIFRGMGKRLSQVEKEAWDKRVDVYFQGKAWADRDFSLEWLEKTYIPWAKGSPGEKLLLMDNLDSQLLKQIIAQELENWLEDDDNLAKWESGILAASERRVLLKFWCAEAWEKLWKKHESMKSFDGTGCNLTIDLSDLEKVRPQNMLKYDIALRTRLLKAREVDPLSLEGETADVEPAVDVSDETDVLNGRGAESASDGSDGLDTDDELVSDDDTVMPGVFWVPEGMEALPEAPALTKHLVGTTVLFKWDVYGWQLGRVKTIRGEVLSGGLSASF